VQGQGEEDSGEDESDDVSASWQLGRQTGSVPGLSRHRAEVMLLLGAFCCRRSARKAGVCTAWRVSPLHPHPTLTLPQPWLCALACPSLPFLAPPQTCPPCRSLGMRSCCCGTAPPARSTLRASPPLQTTSAPRSTCSRREGVGCEKRGLFRARQGPGSRGPGVLQLM
jgi:hypothetical protein